MKMFIIINWIVCICIWGYVFYVIRNKNKALKEQFQKAKDAQEEAIYGKKLVRINSKKVSNCKKISS